jgi:hypothetical protein
MLRTVLAQMAAVAAAPLSLPFQWKSALRTGGPDDPDGDEDEQVRRLMPIMAAVIAIAVIFSR